ncbi:MAG: alanine--glyoxylate aminotransferase family protein [Candidatus Altiarchaeota archaeon]|nr:alanine--glyoxylate aminotransferase family protein [Candidatus Altiarchaeota archaeon]
MDKKLFIPGPVDVLPDVATQCALPMVGHRSKDYAELHGQLVERLKKVMHTQNKVFLSATSSTGWMEAAVRNCVGKKALHVVNGAFSKRWYEISLACDKKADKIDIPWGSAAKPADVKVKLDSGEYDALFITHNETSTCAMTPLDGFGEICKKNNVLLCVDAVSSMCGVKIEVDRLGIDVLVTGTQKCFGVAPGLAMTAVSQAVLDRSKIMKDKGFYFDYMQYLKHDAKNNTPSTPPIPQMNSLNYQLGKIMKVEGLENRFKRHREMAEYTRAWAKKNFALYTEEWCSSDTVTCIVNNRNIDLGTLSSRLSDKGYAFSNGYGDLKGKVFRVPHMADRTMDDLKEYLETIEKIVGPRP